MGSDLIDRRPCARRRGGSPAPFAELEPGTAEAVRDAVWRSLEFDRDDDRGELPDDVAAHLLVEAAAERLAALLEPPVSRRVLRWTTPGGTPGLIVERPTRSRRYGAQADPKRNLRAYLMAEVLGLSLAEIGERLGITKDQARKAKASGGKSAAKVARSRTDPRRPSPSSRPHGLNERPW